MQPRDGAARLPVGVAGVAGAAPGPGTARPQVHLVDATWELFRSWFGAPPAKAPDGREVGATRGVLASLLALLREESVTHVACATDHVIRSFRNALYAGYKTEAGVAPELLAQFPLLEEGLGALGLVVWPMVEFEADDALAAGAARFAAEAKRVVIASPDKDLAQCVRGAHVVLLDRRRKVVTDEAGVRARFGVAPRSIPDWLALVGDAADGYPGLPGWGARSAAAVLSHYGVIEAIPDSAAAWPVAVRGAERLAATLAERREEALLYKRLATLREDVPLRESLEDLAWRGPRPELRAFCARIGFDGFAERAEALARARLG